MHTDRLDWPLPGHRRGTLSGMDAAPEPTWTYLRRVLRWWAGKGPAANAQRRVRCALTRQLVGAHLKAVCRAVRIRRRGFTIEQGAPSTALRDVPTISTGPCRPTVAGP
ncbi:hypothetical protein XarjCFBP7653_11805 [Xanthomonas arboricola]|nr:hypothetical protein XarjCFBP7653_11805 [Xanthomonas arboricola]